MGQRRNTAFIATDGGKADLFWGFIMCMVGMGLVYASLAEMASVYEVRFSAYHAFSRLITFHLVPRLLKANTTGYQNLHHLSIKSS